MQKVVMFLNITMPISDDYPIITDQINQTIEFNDEYKAKLELSYAYLTDEMIAENDMITSDQSGLSALMLS